MHYLNGGPQAIEHFAFLLNCLIENIENAGITEVNTVYANILYKGHGKERTLDSSYSVVKTPLFLSTQYCLYAFKFVTLSMA